MRIEHFSDWDALGIGEAGWNRFVERCRAPVPFATWVRGPWNSIARDVLLDRRTRQRGILEPAAIDRLLSEHAAGRTEGGDRLWTLMNLELWYRTFIDGQGVQTLPAIPVDKATTPAEPARALARTA